MYHNTLGVAEFRLGNYQEAIEAAKISTEKTPKEFNLPSAHPADLAILAMSHHKLGEDAKAQEFHEQVNTSMEFEAFKSDPECISFSTEVNQLLGSPAIKN